jgi:hypothetical protein
MTRGTQPQGNSHQSRRAGELPLLPPRTFLLANVYIGYVGKHFQLPSCRFHPRGTPELQNLGRAVKTVCVMCRYLQQQAKHDPDSEAARTAITQLRTGHGYFNSYLHNIPSADIPSPLCNCRAGEPHGLPHLILTCCYTYRERRTFNVGFGKRRKFRLQDLLYIRQIGLRPTTGLPSGHVHRHQGVAAGAFEQR